MTSLYRVNTSLRREWNYDIGIKHPCAYFYCCYYSDYSSAEKSMLTNIFGIPRHHGPCGLHDHIPSETTIAFNTINKIIIRWETGPVFIGYCCSQCIDKSVLFIFSFRCTHRTIMVRSLCRITLYHAKLFYLKGFELRWLCSCPGNLDTRKHKYHLQTRLNVATWMKEWFYERQ